MNRLHPAQRRNAFDIKHACKNSHWLPFGAKVPCDIVAFAEVKKSAMLVASS
jgi:hypothetical protein